MAEEVIASIKPAMLTIPGAKEILISTPYTPLGILYKRFQEDWGKDSNDVLSWKAPSLTMNPTLSAEKIAKAVAADPDRPLILIGRRANILPNGELVSPPRLIRN